MFSDSFTPMTANKNVILMVALGAIACLLSIFLSQFFAKRIYDNEALLARIERLPPAVEHLQILSKNFVQSGDPITWKRIADGLEALKADLQLTPDVAVQWRAEMDALGTDLESYTRILSRIQEPAILLNREKDRLKSISLSFSQEVEAQIVQPYQQKEGERIYAGGQLDPFKVRIKDTAMEVIRLHLTQQLILLELLVDWDLARYQDKKASIEADLALHQKRLNYLNILLGNEPAIDAIIASLVRKLDSLVLQEQTIFRYFTTITGLNNQLAHLDSRLLVASKAFTGKLRTEISESNRINQMLGWSLPTILLAALGILGALLARNIIQFVKELESNRQELQINESNLKVTLDSIGDAVIATDHQGRITRMNPSAELLTGWKLASAFGRKLSEVFHIVNAHTRARVADPAEKVMASGRVVGLANHTVLLANDGKEYQIADSGAPIRTPDGRIIGVVLVFRDVTESYVQEQKLRESEKQLRKITANVPGVVYRFECTSEYRCTTTFVGENLRQWFGLEPDPATFAQAFRSGIPDEERERYEHSLREAIRQSHPWHYEGQFRKESGERIWFSGDAIPYQEENGTAFYGVVQDITERKRNAETLRQLRNYLSNIINSMPSVLVVVDRKGRVTLWNKSAEQATGLTFDQVHRQPLATVFPRLADQIHSIETALDKREIIRESKVPIQYQDETSFEDITIFPLVANGVEGAVIRLDNVTERVRIEEIMIQSEKMLSVGGLAAGMAHEINNPLAGILQTAEVLANRLSNKAPIPANEKAATTAGTTMLAIQTFMELRGIPRMLKTIKESGSRVAVIVDNMLSFARKSDATVSSYDIAELIDRTLTLAATDYNLKKQYDFKAIEIHKDYGENLPQVPCESAKIQQVLLNVLSNGAQAMVGAGASKPRFILRTRWEPERNSVRIEIEDNGPGMEPAISRRVFEPFYTTKPVGVGTGLGLSVSYFIITENHSGEMSVESSPGKGARFIIRLPVKHRSSSDHR